jgi:pyrroloquinoline quinone biosynthesis protein B
MFRFIILFILTIPSVCSADANVYIQVLGIAQDAGYPQTNCYQPHCIRAWENKELRRLASSIAVVDTEAKTKYLFDATPDMREQLYHLHLSASDAEFSRSGLVAMALFVPAGQSGDRQAETAGRTRIRRR